MVRVRFAPSPTGRLHLGNARTAVLNALFASHHGGAFILRMDDTDDARCRTEYIHSIQEDLRWLGLSWDEYFTQSSRREIHRRLFQTLQNSGRLYPCFETPEQLETWRAEQLSQKLPPRYDRLKGQSIPQHDTPYWRFALSQKSIEWHDLIQGPMACNTRHLSDPVVMRHDGSMSYLLSSAMDDVDLGITHIIRGADHLTNTAIQLEMMQALGGEIPLFAHFPLMLDEHGNKFSKRSGSKTLQELREEGWLPLTTVQSVAQLGLSHHISGDFAHMALDFSLSQYSKSNGKFSIQDMEMVQARLWSHMVYTDLPPQIQDTIDPTLWPVIRDNVVHRKDMEAWQHMCFDPHWVGSDALDWGGVPDHFFEIACNTLQHCGVMTGQSWESDPWHSWVNGILHSCPTLKKGWVCRTLRMALTGRAGGPRMEDLLPLMSPNRVHRRIEHLYLAQRSRGITPIEKGLTH